MDNMTHEVPRRNGNNGTNGTNGVDIRHSLRDATVETFPTRIQDIPDSTLDDNPFKDEMGELGELDNGEEEALSKTEQNHRSRLRTIADDFAIEEGYEPYRMLDHSTYDTERVVKWFVNKDPGALVLAVADKPQYVLLRAPDGLWHQNLEGQQHIGTDGILQSLIMKARRLTFEEIEAEGSAISEFLEAFQLMRLPTDRHIVEVAKQLNGRLINGTDHDKVRRINPESLDRYDEHPCIPTLDGRALDLTTNKYIKPEELGELLFTYKGWNIETSHTDEGPAVALVEKVFGDGGRFEGVLDRIASYLCGISKTIDVFKAETVNHGKTTLFDGVLREALPGMIERVTARETFTPRGEAFSQLKKLLTEKRIVMVDECHKIDLEITSDMLNALTDKTIEVHEKYRPKIVKRRVATQVFVGNEWPPLRVEDIGVPERIGFAAEWKDHKPMPPSEYKLLLSNEAIHHVRYKLTTAAWRIFCDVERLQDADLTPDDFTANSKFNVRSQMFRDLENPVIQNLREHFADQYVDGKCEVLASELDKTLDEICKSENVQKPSGKTLRTLMCRAFPGAINKRKKVKGKKPTIWEWDEPSDLGELKNDS